MANLLTVLAARLKAAFGLGAWRTLLWPAQVLVLPGAVLDTVQAQNHASDDNELPVPSSDTALLAWRDWCAAHVGQRCKVALSSRWVMAAVVPEAQATDAAAAASEMARQWNHYMNINQTALERDWFVRTTQAPGGWLVCATPMQLVNDIMSVAQAQHIKVVWMGPWWTAGLQRWMRQAATMQHAQHLQVFEPGWCLHAQTLRHERQTSLHRLWAEPALSQGNESEGARVALSRQGAAATACVWDDASTQALITGQSPAWREACS